VLLSAIAFIALASRRFSFGVPTLIGRQTLAHVKQFEKRSDFTTAHKPPVCPDIDQFALAHK
jgi:hypothetical protein